MRQYTSVEKLAWEENALAVNTAVSVLKTHLEAIPDLRAVWRVVLARCNEKLHLGLIGWIAQHMLPSDAQKAPAKSNFHLRSALTEPKRPGDTAMH